MAHRLKRLHNLFFYLILTKECIYFLKNVYLVGPHSVRLVELRHLVVSDLPSLFNLHIELSLSLSFKESFISFQLVSFCMCYLRPNIACTGGRQLRWKPINDCYYTHDFQMCIRLLGIFFNRIANELFLEY